MTGTALPRLHTPDEIADALGVSGWWVREQCRKRRIPFTRVGGAYRFTAEHLAEIVGIFEERPEQASGRSAAGSSRRRADPPSVPPVVQLRARQPRRARSGGGGAGT